MKEFLSGYIRYKYETLWFTQMPQLDHSIATTTTVSFIFYQF